MSETPERFRARRTWLQRRYRELLAEGRLEGGYIERQAWCDWQRLPEPEKQRLEEEE